MADVIPIFGGVISAIGSLFSDEPDPAPTPTPVAAKEKEVAKKPDDKPQLAPPPKALKKAPEPAASVPAAQAARARVKLSRAQTTGNRGLSRTRSGVSIVGG